MKRFFTMHKCRLCGAESSSVWSVKDAKIAETLVIFMCNTCALVQQANLPTDEELHIYYSHNYREEYKSTHQPKPKYVHRAGKAALDRLARMRKAGISPGAALLDIGAGGGEFVYMAQQAGFESRGVEPHQGYSEFARDEYGVKIDTCQISDIEHKGFGVVTMFHVLEHLAHPTQVMIKVHQMLKEGGYFVVEVPNITQKDASPHNIYFKAHLFYYSRPSLIAAASPYFDQVYVEDEGNLFIVFKRKDHVLQGLLTPSLVDIKGVTKRLDEKGWREYLFKGGGLTKVFTRIPKALNEHKIKHMRSKAILDQIHKLPNF
nr:class I SAM-dependent methyltransferase [Limnobacter parvus]